MKRAIVQVSLVNERQFVIDIQEPGLIRQFVMGIREKKLLVASTPGKQVMEEVPTLLVEVDPDGGSRQRRFVVLEDGQVAEAPNLIYVGSVMSQAYNGALFHLFEETNAD